jgi:hypothetical protein
MEVYEAREVNRQDATEDRALHPGELPLFRYTAEVEKVAQVQGPGDAGQELRRHVDAGFGGLAMWGLGLEVAGRVPEVEEFERRETGQQSIDNISHPPGLGSRFDGSLECGVYSMAALWGLRGVGVYIIAEGGLERGACVIVALGILRGIYIIVALGVLEGGV